MDIATQLRVVVEALVWGERDVARLALAAIDQDQLVERRAAANDRIWGVAGLARQAFSPFSTIGR
jgi:hypothetical protein